MENLQNSIGNGLVIIFLWCIFSALIHLLFYFTRLWDLIKIDFYQSIPKRYSIKKSPIFEIRESHLCSDMYVYKWDLMYITNPKMSILLCLLIPYPIEVFHYRYSQSGGYRACSKSELEIFSKKYNLEEFYNTEHMKEMEKQKKIDDRDNLLKELNKEFSENYEPE